MTAIQCPRCGLYSPESGTRCDCGYDFVSGEINGSYLKSKSTEPKKKKSLLYKIVAVLIGLFVTVVVVFVVLFGAVLVACGAQKRV